MDYTTKAGFARLKDVLIRQNVVDIKMKSVDLSGLNFIEINLLSSLMVGMARDSSLIRSRSLFTPSEDEAVKRVILGPPSRVNEIVTDEQSGLYTNVVFADSVSKNSKKLCETFVKMAEIKETPFPKAGSGTGDGVFRQRAFLVMLSATEIREAVVLVGRMRQLGIKTDHCLVLVSFDHNLTSDAPRYGFNIYSLFNILDFL